jgi:hypothetical protein
VILPLVGIGLKTTGFGAAKSAQDYEGVYMIGYQLDWARITPEFSDVVMTSVIKRFDQSIALAFAAHIRGDYVNGDEIGSISSGEIQLTPLRGFKDLIPIDFMAELTQMQENSETLSCFVGESIKSESVLPISTVMPTITLTPTLTPTPTSTSTPRPTPTIDKGVYNPDNGHWYRIVNTSRTFNGANYYCRQLGAHLVTISEESENQFVFNLYPYTWLGATDEDSEGGWRWITGEPWTYTSWADGEPNNLDGIEHFLHFKEPNAPLWNDIPNGSLPFICEWDE